MKGKLQIEQEQNKKNRREQMKEERRQMLVCDCYKELKVVPFPTLRLFQIQVVSS